MLFALLAVLVILWLFGYIHIGRVFIPDVNLFMINGHNVTLWDLLILLVVAAVISALPAPLRLIAGVILVLWILSVLGIFAFTGFVGLPSILVLLIIVGLAAVLIGGLA